MRASITTDTTVASWVWMTALHRGCGNIRDNNCNNDSYLEEADMSS